MPQDTVKGERIAKVIARAGVASRRDAEKLISAGLVLVNGVQIDSPALNVSDTDRIVVDGTPLEAPDVARVWIYHKPIGQVTTDRDEKGRQTVFDALPEDMPRVMSVGRLDINSEGLLLLTNDGALKRRLELPSTGLLRKYRVRINGRPKEAALEQLRAGITYEGVHYQPMDVVLDRQQGANAWLTVGIREGKNREIRKTMAAMGWTVNRLIRVSYGPFQLGQLKEGQVEELRRKVLRDQLGLSYDDVAPPPTGKPSIKGNARKPGASKASFGKPNTGRLGGGKPTTDKSGPRLGKPNTRKPSAAETGARAGRSGPSSAKPSRNGAQHARPPRKPSR